MTDTTDIHLERARREIALEDSAAAERRITDRANALRETEARTALLRSLAQEHGLPADAAADAIRTAMKALEDDFWSGFIGKSHATFPARYAALCRELGLDDTKVERSDVWLKMRQTGHKLCGAVRDPNTGGFVTEPAA
jgi:hypothetical protein